MKEKQVQSYLEENDFSLAKKKCDEKGISFATYIRLLIKEDLQKDKEKK